MNTPKYLIALALLAAALTTAQAQTTATDSASRSPMTPRPPLPPRPLNGRADYRDSWAPNAPNQRPQRDAWAPNPRNPRDPWMTNAPRPDGGKHGRGPAGVGMDHGMRGGRANALTALTTVSGTVGQLTGNDDAILDGFTLTGSASVTSVSFAPHLGQQVQQAIKPGTAVSVTGFADKNRDGETHFRLISLTAGKTTVLDAPPVRPAIPPAAPTMTTATGKITDYKLDKRGSVNGLVLSDNTIVRIPPQVAYQLTNLATKGTTITVQGYSRPLGAGQVQLQRNNILRASVLTINGQQYLVR